jgi:hypothetical protein
MKYIKYFKNFKPKRWRKKVPKNQKINSRRPVNEPTSPEEMLPGREYDQTQPDLPLSFTLKT